MFIIIQTDTLISDMADSKQKKLHDAAVANSILHKRTLRGQFGWSILGKEHIPYIFRGEENYYAVRMIQLKLFNKYLNVLHQDIYKCTNIPSYYVTEDERLLLNEINFVHCDSIFGKEGFTSRDLLVKKSDAVEFNGFLQTCYSKLWIGRDKLKTVHKCGFIKINNEVVPYVMHNHEPFVPFFYLECDTGSLTLPVKRVEGLDLCYLKFCCKVQGTHVLNDSESCTVVSLKDIKQHFPSGTTFDNYWPEKVADAKFLINKQAVNVTQMGLWTKPTHSPPSIQLANIKAGGAIQQTNCLIYNTVQSNIEPINNLSCLIVREPTPRSTKPLIMQPPLPPLAPIHLKREGSPVNRVKKLTKYQQKDKKTVQKRFIQIPEHPQPADVTKRPYKIKYAAIESKVLDAISMTPFRSEMLITIQDFIRNFFDHVSIQMCMDVLQVLSIDLYKPNSTQMQILVENGSYRSMFDEGLLVPIRHVVEFMPQLKYMFAKLH